jgi:thymidylate kinase
MNKLQPTFVIAFMGVDGSGKSTLIKELNKQLKKKYKQIKNLHLRPYFFFIDKRTVNKNPHNQKPVRSQFASLAIIMMWLFVYRIFFFINLKKKHRLIIFDRYAHDLLIDKVRYRFNLSQKITQFILNLFPQPHLWLILKAPIRLIEKRKKELPTPELKRQLKEYMHFYKKKKQHANFKY